LTVGSSILLTRTTMCLTPAVLTSIACSRVCPPLSKPVSNSPLRADMTLKQTLPNPCCNKTNWAKGQVTVTDGTVATVHA
jgi:hypothetical protein